jgi:hypothetical protein
MLTVAVRFYVTSGGILAALLILLRISFVLGSFKRSFDDHLEADKRMFESLGTDVRELRARRR